MEPTVDLLLINPGARAQMYGKLGTSLAGIEPPLWCALLAAFIRERGYSVKILDSDADNLTPEQTAAKISEINPLLAGIIVLGVNPSASSTPKMTAVSETLTALRRVAPHIKTILGGLHPSAIPERTLREEKVDFVCRGEGFHTFPRLLENLKAGKSVADREVGGLWYRRNGRIVSGPPEPAIEDLDELPVAAWDLLPMDKYRAHNWQCFENPDQRGPYAVIYTSLGCPFNCSYCNIHALYGGKPGIRFRSPEKVTAEIDLLVKRYHIRHLKIIDELFALREDRVERICDLIIRGGYDINIWAYARVDTVNEKMLRKMKQAGINWLCYGFESASERVRQGVSKKTEQDMTRRAIEMTYAAGIHIIANFIFGLPDDDLASMQATLDMAREFNFEYVNLYTAMAYPGSQLYEEAVRDGLRLPETWHGYAQLGYETLPLPTKHLTAAEVLRFRDRAFVEYYRNPKYLKMIGEKFGPGAVAHIKGMLRHRIERKYARDEVGGRHLPGKRARP
ncbi:MAG TPA: radical SAM protein [Dehalococcoidales bacterium]|nr:radical SAM protein [Dehalococcoidales bacterium]